MPFLNNQENFRHGSISKIKDIIISTAELYATCYILKNKRLLLHQFSKLVSQGFTPQSVGNNNTLGIEQEIGRYGLYAI
jgi:hypothetical protein